MDIDALVAQLRTIGTDTATMEVKSAVGALPKSVPETLSAFANGVVVVLWVDHTRRLLQGLPARTAPTAEAPRERKLPKVGKNDPCPCGSGKLYRRCHGKEAAA